MNTCSVHRPPLLFARHLKNLSLCTPRLTSRVKLSHHVHRRQKEAAAGGEEGQQQEPKQAAQPALPEKVIVFSQWTRMLDLVERTLRQNRIRFARLDGSMSVPSRESAIRTFTVSCLCCRLAVSPAPRNQLLSLMRAHQLHSERHVLCAVGNIGAEGISYGACACC